MAGNPLASLPGLPQRPSLARSSASETRLTQPGIEAARSRKLNSAPTAAFRIKLQAALITSLFHVKGQAAPETTAASERARVLIEQAEAIGEPLEDPLLLFSVLYG